MSHQLKFTLSEGDGVSTEVVCSGHEAEACGFREVFSWDSLAALEGFYGEAHLLAVVDVEVTSIDEEGGVAWKAADSETEVRPLLSEVDLVWGSPGHIEMTSDGGGEFASVFRLNARGVAKVAGARELK